MKHCKQVTVLFTTLSLVLSQLALATGGQSIRQGSHFRIGSGTSQALKTMQKSLDALASNEDYAGENGIENLVAQHGQWNEQMIDQLSEAITDQQFEKTVNDSLSSLRKMGAEKIASDLEQMISDPVLTAREKFLTLVQASQESQMIALRLKLKAAGSVAKYVATQKMKLAAQAKKESESAYINPMAMTRTWVKGGIEHWNNSSREDRMSYASIMWIPPFIVIPAGLLVITALLFTLDLCLLAPVLLWDLNVWIFDERL